MDPMGYAKFKPQFLHILDLSATWAFGSFIPIFSSRGPEVLAMPGVMTPSIFLGASSTITCTPHGTSEPLCHMQYFNRDGKCGNIKLLIVSENFGSSSPRRDRCAVGSVGKFPFSIGNTSSNGGISIVMLFLFFMGGKFHHMEPVCFQGSTKKLQLWKFKSKSDGDGEGSSCHSFSLSPNTQWMFLHSHLHVQNIIRLPRLEGSNNAKVNLGDFPKIIVHCLGW